MLEASTQGTGQGQDKEVETVSKEFRTTAGTPTTQGTQDSHHECGSLRIDCNQLGTKLFFLSLRKAPSGEAVSYNNAGTTQEEDVDLLLIPEEYHEFIDLYCKKKVDQLPPHGPYDHRIALMPRSKLSCRRVQRLSLAEGEELGMYVTENLKKGFIRHSQAEYRTPIIFARKKDSSLRICVNYRGLNKLTIKNVSN